ncbi:hypothetical protein THIOSC15_2880019 [uncultured Thiomicrorhabdus sp.]
MTEKVGANVFISKWHADQLAKIIVARIDAISESGSKAG